MTVAYVCGTRKSGKMMDELIVAMETVAETQRDDRELRAMLAEAVKTARSVGQVEFEYKGMRFALVADKIGRMCLLELPLPLVEIKTILEPGMVECLYDADNSEFKLRTRAYSEKNK